MQISCRQMETQHQSLIAFHVASDSETDVLWGQNGTMNKEMMTIWAYSSKRPAQTLACSIKISLDDETE